MDNASKALIMAGAILIAVALVGMGIYLVSVISNPADSAVTLIDTNDILTKNQQITMYCDDAVKGSEVKTLLQLINTMNTQDYFPNPVVVTGDTVTGDAFTPTEIDAAVTAAARYDVTWTPDADGYVAEVDIQKTT